VPQPKVDLSTVNGRVQYAREQAGYRQDEFAKLINYEPSSWQKIEQGQRRLSIEKLEEANAVLDLDIRYYFGQIPYQDAVSRAGNNYAALAKKIEDMEKRLSPGSQVDEVTAAWLGKPQIRNIVRKIASLDDQTLDKIDGVVMGALLFAQQNESERAAQ